MTKEKRGSLEFTSPNVESTIELGRKIASVIEPGLLVTLQGTLGAGKTSLVQSIGEALGIDRHQIVSPTFALIQVHAGRYELVHIDAWRIADDDQFFELGIDEYLDSDAIVAMEWADKFADLLPNDQLGIVIDILDEQERKFTIHWECSEDSVSGRVGKRLSDKLQVSSCEP